MFRSNLAFRWFFAAGMVTAAICCAVEAARFFRIVFGGTRRFDIIDVLLLVGVAAGIAVAARAYPKSSRRGWRICKHCGYNLRMIISRECPECGHQAPFAGEPRTLDEQIVAGLHGRKLHDLEPPQPEE